MVEATSLVFAFASGVFLLLSPCGIPMLPAYLAYYLGGAESANAGWSKSAARGLIGGLIASAGALVVLGILSAIGYFAGNAVTSRFIDLELVGGIIVIAMGAWFVAGKDLAFAVPVSASGKPGIVGLLTFGGLYAAVAAGCSFAIFIGFIFIALAAPTPLDVILQFASFGLGFSILLVGVTIGASTASAQFLNRVKRAVPVVKRLAGVVMVLMGVYLINYWWNIPR